MPSGIATYPPFCGPTETRHTPHETTGEKPSFLLFGYDCRTPSEAALLPPSDLEPTPVSDYRDKVMLSLSSARDSAVQSIKQAQVKYNKAYDRRSAPSRVQVGDWVLVRFPQEEVGKIRKLSRPWHGPFQVLTSQLLLSSRQSYSCPSVKVTPCPNEFPSGFYWYGTKRHSPGRPPKWVQRLLAKDADVSEEENSLVEDALPP